MRKPSEGHQPTPDASPEEDLRSTSSATSGNLVVPVTYYFESREQAGQRRQTRGQFFLYELGEPVMDALKETAGGVAVAIGEAELKQNSPHHDAALIEALQELQTRGIPFDLWANLPDEKGYWIYQGNVDDTKAAILEMLDSAEQQGVNFRNVGLDLEMKGPELGPAALWANLKLAPGERADVLANEKLHQFISEVLAAGIYGVDTYELPIMSDSEAVRRRLGILKPPTREEITDPRYRRVAMVYRTVFEMSMPKLVRIPTPRFIEKYSHEKGRVPALGIISASVENPGRGGLDPKLLLSDAQLEEDVSVALRGSNRELFIFALNGLPVIQRVRKAIEAALKPLE